MAVLLKNASLRKPSFKFLFAFLILLTFAHCSPPQEAEQEKKISPAEELERHVFSVILSKESSYAKSGMFIEFPAKKYGLSVEEFLGKTSGLSPVEKIFKDYLNNRSKKDKVIKILMALHLGNLVQFSFLKEDSNGQKNFGVVAFKKINEGKYQRLQGFLPYHASFTVLSAMKTLIEPENYPPLPQDIVKSLGPDSIQFVMPFKDKGNHKPEDIPKEKRIVLYLKGNPFYLNILDESISEEFFEKNPALDFYRQYLQALSSGTKEDVYKYYWEPDTLKKRKQSLESLTKEQFKYYGKGEAEDGSEIRFLIDADPYYLIIYAMRKGPSPDKEIWKVARIYKTQNAGYKMTDIYLNDDLTHLLFRTAFKDRVLMPKIMARFEKTENK